MSVFSRAWKKLKDRVEDKPSWTELEIKNLMFECLHEAAVEMEDKIDEAEFQE